MTSFRCDNSNPFELPEARFMELFRFPQVWILHLIELITPHFRQAVRSSTTPAHIKVAALYFYANGAYQRTLNKDYYLGNIIN